MTTSIQQYQSMIAEFQLFQQNYASVGVGLDSLIAIGTTLHSDPNFAASFPISWGAYQAYLVQVQTVINTFRNSLPIAPPLNG